MRMLHLCLLLMLTLGLWPQQPVDTERMLKDPEWKMEFDSFSPDPAMLDSLDRCLREPVRIDIYFAFWCSDSKREVPRFLKIINHLRNSEKLEIRFFEMAHKSGPEQKYYEEAAKVEKIPTFICFRGGKELGRIVETPQLSLVEDLLTILF